MRKVGGVLAGVLSAVVLSSCGTWAIVTSPPVTDQSGNPVLDAQLNGVSCPTTTFCVAVGSQTASYANRQPLIESGAPANPVIVSLPSDYTGNLNSVSCASSTFCVAVGTYSPEAGTTLPLVETYNGSSWSIATTTAPSSPPLDLKGVSCPTTTFCMAVGLSSGENSSLLTFTESWNGTSWSTTPSPNAPGFYQDQLFSVSCPSTTMCMAVGTDTGASDLPQTLAEAFNGTTWSIVSSPNESASSSNESVTNSLSGVSCPTANSCMAVGGYSTSTYPHQPDGTSGQTLAESFNGTAWSIVPSANADGMDGLEGISCITAGMCVAVGFTDLGTSQTLIENYLGSWYTRPSADTATTDPNQLVGVSCASAVACTAVGNETPGGVPIQPTKTLVERLVPPGP